MVDDVQWFVGIDWATQSHCVCLLDAEGRQVGQREFAHGGAGLTELHDWLLEKTKAAPGQIAVAIETTHGPVVEMLLEHGFEVFAINPKQLDRFRSRITDELQQERTRLANRLRQQLWRYYPQASRAPPQRASYPPLRRADSS